MLCLYHAPLACSIAARFALVEAGVPHEVKFIRTWKGENKTEAFLAINARGKVPVLVTDEGTLTESTAILPFIADLAPEKGLFPEPGGFARVRPNRPVLSIQHSPRGLCRAAHAFAGVRWRRRGRSVGRGDARGRCADGGETTCSTCSGSAIST